MKRIIIVGAGAAGMLAAKHAKTKYNQVITTGYAQKISGNICKSRINK